MHQIFFLKRPKPKFKQETNAWLHFWFVICKLNVNGSLLWHFEFNSPHLKNSPNLKNSPHLWHYLEKQRILHIQRYASPISLTNYTIHWDSRWKKLITCDNSSWCNGFDIRQYEFVENLAKTRYEAFLLSHSCHTDSVLLVRLVNCQFYVLDIFPHHFWNAPIVFPMELFRKKHTHSVGFALAAAFLRKENHQFISRCTLPKYKILKFQYFIIFSTTRKMTKTNQTKKKKTNWSERKVSHSCICCAHIVYIQTIPKYTFHTKTNENANTHINASILLFKETH